MIWLVRKETDEQKVELYLFILEFNCIYSIVPGQCNLKNTSFVSLFISNKWHKELSSLYLLLTEFKVNQ